MLYATSLVLEFITGLQVEYCILIVTLIAVIYTFMGGIAAVIWTDVIQAGILFAGALVILIALLGEMLPKNIFIQIYDALLQTSTSEHASRMRAMENATKACEDMIDELQTIFNKTRQAGITSDLMDIVGGAEALNG